MEIKIIKDKISITDLQNLAQENFGDMIKAVVDIKQSIMALGGELHADAEEILIKEGSEQKNLWGINIYPDRTKEEMIEYTSLINIRPSVNNRSLEVEDQEVRKKIANIINSLIR